VSTRGSPRRSGSWCHTSRLEAPELLFRKIADEDLEAWINRFGGPA